MRCKLFGCGSVVPLALLLLSLAAGPVRGDTITYKTPAGSTVPVGGPVSAEATFVTSTDQITISLTNTQTGMKDAAQLITDLFFTVSSGQTSATVNAASSGVERTVAKNKTFSDGAAVAPGWDVSADGGGIELDVLGSKIGPAHGIIGPASADSKYDNANGSIAGNKAHNPFLAGTVTFVLDVKGVTAGSTITSATFSFGTVSGVNVDGVKPTPEPSSAVLLGLGVVGLGGVWYLRQRRKLAVI
jgi:hypothetical protein